MAIKDLMDRLVEQIRDEQGHDTGMILQIFTNGRTFVRFVGVEGCGILEGAACSLEKGTGMRERGSEIPFLEFMERETQISLNRDSTKLVYVYANRLLREYAESSVRLEPSFPISEVNSDFLYGFEDFLRSRGMSVNTIARNMKVVKKFVNIARKKKLISTYPFLNYTIRTESTMKRVLSESELRKLEDYRESLSERNEYLDAFLFACYTGLRFSDVCRVTKQDIRSIYRRKWLMLKMRKTGSVVRVPISVIFDGKALSITRSIQRNRGQIFRLENNQKTNRELRKIAKACRIQPFSFHTARHTCATLLLYKGVSITTVQSLLGHSSVKTTQIYSTVTDLTIVKEIRKSNRKLKK